MVFVCGSGSWIFFLLPFVGMLIAAMIHHIAWRRGPVKTEGTGWTFLGGVVGFLGMCAMLFLCGPVLHLAFVEIDLGPALASP
jgi:hypothetical protein